MPSLLANYKDVINRPGFSDDALGAVGATSAESPKPVGHAPYEFELAPLHDDRLGECRIPGT